MRIEHAAVLRCRNRDGKRAVDIVERLARSDIVDDTHERASIVLLRPRGDLVASLTVRLGDASARIGEAIPDVRALEAAQVVDRAFHPRCTAAVVADERRHALVEPRRKLPLRPPSGLDMEGSA